MKSTSDPALSNNIKTLKELNKDVEYNDSTYKSRAMWYTVQKLKNWRNTAVPVVLQQETNDTDLEGNNSGVDLEDKEEDITSMKSTSDPALSNTINTLKELVNQELEYHDYTYKSRAMWYTVQKLKQWRNAAVPVTQHEIDLERNSFGRKEEGEGEEGTST